MRVWLKISKVLAVATCLLEVRPAIADEPVGVPIDEWVQVSNPVYKRNRSTGLWQAKLALFNRSKPKRTVYGPFTVVVTSTNRPEAALSEPSGVTADGLPYRMFAVREAGLKPRKSVGNLILRFDNPTRKNFRAHYAVYGLLDPNQLPVAEAGSDRFTAVGGNVNLDGFASSDADGHPLRYSWNLISKPPGSNAALALSEGVTTRFTADLAGSYQVQLVVSDRIADSPPDLVTITANSSTVNVPNLFGLNRSAAETAITAAGLTVGRTAELPRITAKAGMVIGQIPSRDTGVTPGSPVVLVLAAPPPVKQGEAIPAAWSGHWKITTVYRDSQTDAINSVVETIDDICAGDPIGIGLVEQVAGEHTEVKSTACNGQAAENHISASCAGGIEASLCTADLKASAEMALSGESILAVGSWTTTNTCGMPELPQGQTFNISGVRLGPADAASCTTPSAFLQRFLRNPLLLRLGGLQ